MLERIAAPLRTDFLLLAFRSSRCSRSHWRLRSRSLYGIDSVLPFADEFTHLCQCAGFYTLAPANQHDGLAIRFRGASCLTNANFKNSFSEFLIRNRLSVAVFRTFEIHHAWVVS